MTQDPHELPWPAEAGDLDDLAREMEPPATLEDRVVRAFHERRLLRRGRQGATSWARLPAPRWAQAAAVALLLAGGGYLAGRATAPGAAAVPEASQYAFLLYESSSFEPAEGAERLTRYHEYSAWVSEARRRGQFVDGKDLATDGGWVLSPGTAPRAGAPTAGDDALSGLFLITAHDPDHALELARRVPHLRYGGRVVVQKVLRTDVPPADP